jgi:HlyD family secretion protein
VVAGTGVSIGKGENMVKKSSCWFVAIALLACLLAGCAAANAAPLGGEIKSPVRTAAGTVFAEGIVVPARSAHLGARMTGAVSAVWVQPGDQVDAGKPLIRLDARQIELMLAMAEQDVRTREAALAMLIHGASARQIERADKVRRDQIDQARMEVQIVELELARAREQVPQVGPALAQVQTDQAQARLAQMRVQDPGTAVALAEIALARAQIALADTQDEYAKALDRPWEDQSIRDAWAKNLEQAQLDYRAAQARLEQAQDARAAHEQALRVLALQVAESRLALEQAVAVRATYTHTLSILELELSAARLRLLALEASDHPLRDEPAPETVAQAEATLEQSRLSVERLRLQLEDAVLAAPFAGTIVDVLVDPGDDVALGQVVVVLATLDHHEVRTVDLLELDVAKVAVGQAALVRVDGLPGRFFAGTVETIALQGQDYRGDVVYEVVVALDRTPELEGLRWGMTTEVEIDIQ